MQFLLDEIRMASNGKRERAKCHGMQKSYYHIIEKQSDMERRHGTPHIVTSHSFLSQNFSVVFITESHEELWGKSDVMAGEKKKARKMPVDGMMQAESISYTI